MAKTGFKSVDEYIAAQSETVQGILHRVRRTIREAVPEAEEAISYHIPSYKLPGGPVLFFAAWKRHYSLYPVTGRTVSAFQDELAPYKIGKGTIRFLLSQPVPVKLIGRIAKVRAEEVGGRAKAKLAAPKKSSRSHKTRGPGGTV